METLKYAEYDGSAYLRECVKKQILESIHRLRSTKLSIFCGAKIFDVLDSFSQANSTMQYLDLAGCYIGYNLDVNLKSTDLVIQDENGVRLKLVE